MVRTTRRRHATARRRRIAAIALASIASALVGAIAWAALSPAGHQFIGAVAIRIALGDRPINVLFIANNARDVKASDPLGLGSAAGQADAIVLAHFDPKDHAIYAITVPRDTLVAQPGWHNPVPKIKTLFYMGNQEKPKRGPQLLAKAVADLTGLPVDGYIVANFASFKAAVDLVGGLTIDVKKRIYDPHDAHADFRPGVQHMNGAQALAFVRVRQNHAGNDYRIDDFQRMQAEVTVLGLLRDRVLDPKKVAVLPRFISSMKGNIATNFSEDELVRLAIASNGAPVYQVPLGTIADAMSLSSASLPGVNADGRIIAAAYDVLDPDKVQARLAKFGSHSSNTGLDPSSPPATIPVRFYGSAHMALRLEHQGFRRVKRVSGRSGENRVTYPAGHPSWGWQVARAMATGGAVVEPGNVDAVIARE
jgi:LCP family protein required for cell wall assembly